jgi:hypothetical protein
LTAFLTAPKPPNFPFLGAVVLEVDAEVEELSRDAEPSLFAPIPAADVFEERNEAEFTVLGGARVGEDVAGVADREMAGVVGLDDVAEPE